jgi:hypothetical protein
MSDQLIHAITEEPIQFNQELRSGDDKTYIMFPDHSKVLCQLIDDSGNYIKSDGTPGEEQVWCKVCDQRCFYSDILYWVIPLSKIIDGEYDVCKDGASTRASLISQPISKLDEKTGN